MIEKFGLVKTNAKAVSVGDIFGRLTVLAVGQKANYKYFAVCSCSCGSEIKAIRIDHLVMGFTVSCGCFQKEASTTHGQTKSPHYSRWRLMIDRCTDQNCRAYKDYGARGIKVCDRWLDINNYIADLPDGYQEGLELDRINNDGDYEPGNVKWSSKSENCSNRRSSRIIEFNGEKLTAKEWGARLGMSHGAIAERLDKWGWDVEKALTTPPLDDFGRMKRAHEFRWAGHVKKQKTQPKIVRTVEYNGSHVNLAELSRLTGISGKLLYKRIFERGWPIEKATKELP